MSWAERGELVLDHEGILWRWSRTDEDAQLRRLGPVDRADVPEGLEADRAWLLDLWLDGFDARAEALAAWYRSRI